VAMILGAGGAPLAAAPTAVRRRVTRLGLRGDRSITVSLSSGICLVGSAGSIVIELATSAMSSFGDTATLVGGPARLLGTSISASTLGGVALRSIKVRVSGSGLFCTSCLPLTSLTLASLAETAISAYAAAAVAPSSRAART